MRSQPGGWALVPIQARGRDQLTGVVYERALSPAERAEFAELVGSVGSRILG
jgi:hypothetical protein